MIIALDYDGTITLDANFWIDFCIKARDSLITVYVVTMRHEHEPIDFDEAQDIIYTCRKAKAEFMASLGIKVDIWIDDNPCWIYNDSL